ncbi:Bgt-50579 [Blumeria graminis f. sp. tritici]|uniref:Bgt-50579 n=1 Tax=Blumeria graminis f. sp. tritici TaxID=62690 RepID=A0A9X9LBI3_BLUGR|nr:Bgt-50579 [Blumeria graminis f. sp. tritici]
MVKCYDNYKCEHGAIISAEQITNTLTSPGIKTNKMSSVVIDDERRHFYWREISVAPEYLAKNGATFSYRVVFYNEGIFFDILEVKHAEIGRQIISCEAVESKSLFRRKRIPARNLENVYSKIENVMG